MRLRARSPSQRLLLATVLLGLFVVFDIALFSWLILRSLSEREIRQILVEARTEAQELANQIAGEMEREDRDLYTAIVLETQTQTYIDSVLSQRAIFTKVEIWDDEGKVIFRSEKTVTDSDPDLPDLSSSELGPEIETRTLEQEVPYEVVQVPVGTVGSFVIGISQPELERRLTVLRRELLRQASFIGVLTLLLFIFAYLLIWRLVRRSQRLEEQAKEAERLAYVGTLASGLAHEIRSPLNSLNLNMQMLEEEVNEKGEVHSGRRLLAITRSEIGRLERLVTDFLTYARPRPLETEDVRAVALLEHTSQVLAGQAKLRGAVIDIDERSPGARVRVDRAQMGQLLLNLAQNALAATADKEGPARICLAVERSGPHVVLEVSDNGVGMTEDEKRHMFDLFYSTRKGGAGLGLAIVDRIARAHNGRIEVETRPGDGTRVRLLLPLPEGRKGPEREARVTSSVVSRTA